MASDYCPICYATLWVYRNAVRVDRECMNCRRYLYTEDGRDRRLAVNFEEWSWQVGELSEAIKTDIDLAIEAAQKAG